MLVDVEYPPNVPPVAVTGASAPKILTPELMLRAPIALIGTPDECIVELRRRVKDWGVTQFIFSGGTGDDEKRMRRLKEDILAHV
jgi:hypothetical protein